MMHADYDMGYGAGESSVSADWHIALSEVLGDDIDIKPSVIAALLEQIAEAVRKGVERQGEGYRNAGSDALRIIDSLLHPPGDVSAMSESSATLYVQPRTHQGAEPMSAKAKTPSDTEPMTIRHIRIPDPLWVQAATKANGEGDKISAVVRRLLRAYVDGRI